jgi:hypothetical protein
MTEELIAQSIKVTESFINAMFKWEVDAYIKLSETASFKNSEAAIRLHEIHQEHLTNKIRKLSRSTTDNGIISCTNIGSPPEYNPSKESITSCETKNKSTAVVYTNVSDRFDETHKIATRYTIHATINGARIDKKEQFSENKGKWTPVIL